MLLSKQRIDMNLCRLLDESDIKSSRKQTVALKIPLIREEPAVLILKYQR